MADLITKIPFLAEIKETKEVKELISYGFGAKDTAGVFYHRTKYKLIKPLHEKKFKVGRNANHHI